MTNTNGAFSIRMLSLYGQAEFKDALARAPCEEPHCLCSPCLRGSVARIGLALSAPHTSPSSQLGTAATGSKDSSAPQAPAWHGQLPRGDAEPLVSPGRAMQKPAQTRGCCLPAAPRCSGQAAAGLSQLRKAPASAVAPAVRGRAGATARLGRPKDEH